MSLIRSVQKNYVNILILLSLISLLNFGCDSGSSGGCGSQAIGPDGSVLVKYQTPQALRAFIETAVQLPDDPDQALYDADDRNFAVPIWILDTRTRAQYNRGHIPKAKNVPYDMGSGKIDFDKVPDDIYLIMYCETGGRAQMAANTLAEKGYTKYMVWGGVTDWPYRLVTD